MGEMRKRGSVVFGYNRMHMKKRVIALVALLFVSTVALPSANAQTTHAQTGVVESITMSPSSSKYKIDAGKTINDQLTVVNDGGSAYDFLVYARPYSIVGNDYTNPNFTATPTNADVYGWVEFPQTKYHLAAGASTTVPYSIHVPVGAAPGGHYGVIFAETQPVLGATTGNSVIRKKRVGSIIYATVNGTYRTGGQVTGSEIPFWQVQPPLHSTVSAHNSGNTDFTDTVRLTVRDVLGNVKYGMTKDYQILPDTSRTMVLDWKESSWFGLYKVETQQEFLGKTVKNEGYVLMMPRFIPIALLVVIVIGGVYAWIRRRKS